MNKLQTLRYSIHEESEDLPHPTANKRMIRLYWKSYLRFDFLLPFPQFLSHFQVLRGRSGGTGTVKATCLPITLSDFNCTNQNLKFLMICPALLISPRAWHTNKNM